MRDFKKAGKKIGKNLLFFTILIGIFAKVSNILEAASMGNDNLVQDRNKSVFRILREPEHTIDAVVLGDSLSYSAISPMELWEQQGITSYVCGQSGQKIQETYHMLETVFKTQSPKLVILETNTMFRGEPGLPSIRESIEEWGNHYIPIFRNHDIWKTFLINKRYPEENYKGFAFRCSVQPYEKGEYMQVTEQKAKIPSVVLTYMEKIEKLCRDKEAELLLLATPSPMNYNYGRHVCLREYAEAHSLTFLDLNLNLGEVGIDWKTDSLDGGDHLNLSGAQKVSKYLGEYLRSRYELSDHRGEASHAAWTKEAEQYRKKAEGHLKEMFKERGDLHGSTGAFQKERGYGQYG